MKLSKLFIKLREYGINTVNLCLKQFKEVCSIFYSCLAPSEQRLCRVDFENLMRQDDKQVDINPYLYQNSLFISVNKEVSKKKLNLNELNKKLRDID